MCERLCRDPCTCAPSDSVYAFVSIALHGAGREERRDRDKETGTITEGPFINATGWAHDTGKRV